MATVAIIHFLIFNKISGFHCNSICMHGRSDDAVRRLSHTRVIVLACRIKSLRHNCVSTEVTGFRSILLQKRLCTFLHIYAMCQPSIMLGSACKWLMTGTLRPTPRPFRQRRPIRANGKTFRIKSVHPSAGARQSNNWLKLILNHVCMDLEPSASRNRRTADRHSFPLCYWIHANTVSSVGRTAGGCVFPDRPCRMTAFSRQSFTRLQFIRACKCTIYIYKDRVIERTLCIYII